MQVKLIAFLIVTIFGILIGSILQMVERKILNRKRHLPKKFND